MMLAFDPGICFVAGDNTPEPPVLDFSDIEKRKLPYSFVGREWLLAEVDDWIKKPSKDKLFLILGDAGTGKSAIAVQVCQARKIPVLARHICSSDDAIADTLSPSTFVEHIISECRRNLPAYKLFVDEAERGGG